MSFFYDSVNWQFKLTWLTGFSTGIGWVHTCDCSWLGPPASEMCLVMSWVTEMIGLYTQQVNLGSAPWCLGTLEESPDVQAFQASLCVTFANTAFPKLITEDDSNSMGEHHQQPWIKLRKRVTCFAINHMGSPLKHMGWIGRPGRFLSCVKNA